MWRCLGKTASIQLSCLATCTLGCHRFQAQNVLTLDLHLSSYELSSHIRHSLFNLHFTFDSVLLAQIRSSCDCTRRFRGESLVNSNNNIGPVRNLLIGNPLAGKFAVTTGDALMESLKCSTPCPPVRSRSSSGIPDPRPGVPPRLCAPG